MSDIALPVDGTPYSLRTTNRGIAGGALDEYVALADLHQITDIFKNVLVGSRYNTVEVHLDDANWTNYVTRTLTSGGTTPQVEGSVHFTTGANATGRATAVSLDNVVYRPLHEVYAAWTAAWPDGGAVGADLRIGWGDSAYVNGLFTTIRDGVFGALYCRNGVEVAFVPQASWDDPCDGTNGSLYTLAGVPVAMDSTKKQVFLGRAGLLGSLGLELWCWSPDQQPVKVHTFARPNESLAGIFTNFDLPILCDARKTSGVGSYRVVSACWAGGATTDKIRLSDISLLSSRSLAVLGANVSIGYTTGGGGGFVVQKVNPSGAAVVDATGSAVIEQTGTFGYLSGTLNAGSPTFTLTGRLLNLRVYASGADATFNISGGSTITVRQDTGFDLSPRSLASGLVLNWVSGSMDVFAELV